MKTKAKPILLIITFYINCLDIVHSGNYHVYRFILYVIMYKVYTPEYVKNMCLIMGHNLPYFKFALCPSIYTLTIWPGYV